MDRRKSFPCKAWLRTASHALISAGCFARPTGCQGLGEEGPDVRSGEEVAVAEVPRVAAVLRPQPREEPLSPLPRLNFTVEEGPEVILLRSDVVHRMWTTAWAAATNGTLLHPSSGTFNFYNPSNSTASVQLNFEGNGPQWTTINSTSTLQPGDNFFEFSPSNSTLSTMWFEHVEGQIVIHLGSYI